MIDRPRPTPQGVMTSLLARDRHVFLLAPLLGAALLMPSGCTMEEPEHADEELRGVEWPAEGEEVAEPAPPVDAIATCTVDDPFSPPYAEVVCAKQVSCARARAQNMLNSCAECGGDGRIPPGMCCETEADILAIVIGLLATPCADYESIRRQIEEVIEMLGRCDGLCDGCPEGWPMAAYCTSCSAMGYTACQQGNGCACCGSV
jgi:hypothetical protein